MRPNTSNFFVNILNFLCIDFLQDNVFFRVCNQCLYYQETSKCKNNKCLTDTLEIGTLEVIEIEQKPKILCVFFALIIFHVTSRHYSLRE